MEDQYFSHVAIVARMGNRCKAQNALHKIVLNEDVYSVLHSDVYTKEEFDLLREFGFLEEEIEEGEDGLPWKVRRLSREGKNEAECLMEEMDE